MGLLRTKTRIRTLKSVARFAEIELVTHCVLTIMRLKDSADTAVADVTESLKATTIATPALSIEIEPTVA